MAISVDHAGRKPLAPDESVATLQETLYALLDFTGATAGWVGLIRPDGRLVFPARAGAFSEAWLTLQQGRSSLWGFEIRDEPTVLNDPPALDILGQPPLRNLVVCALRRGARPAGQLAVANKAPGFTPQDVTAVQMMAHYLSGQLIRPRERARPSLYAASLRRALDQVHEGILIVDHTGALIFANATWEQWTGYASEELCNRPPPFPFWISHAELAALNECKHSLPDTLLTEPNSGARKASETGVPKDLFPFRHRNHSLFWCQMETTAAEIGGEVVTIAFLRQAPTAPGVAAGEHTTASSRTAAPPRAPEAAGGSASPTATDSTPRDAVDSRATKGMALLLRPGHAIELWDEHWEAMTGLTRQDVAGVSRELFLDWLLPRQHDRSFVADLFHQPERCGAQALLEIAGRHGNRPLLCTFLPVRASDIRFPVNDAWLLLACSPELTATEQRSTADEGTTATLIPPRREALSPGRADRYRGQE